MGLCAFKSTYVVDEPVLCDLGLALEGLGTHRDPEERAAPARYILHVELSGLQALRDEIPYPRLTDG